jgi:hypothetical protein
MVKWQVIAILTGEGSCILVWRTLLAALAVKTEGKNMVHQGLPNTKMTARKWSTR